jgi:hypothetical protein
MCSGEIPHLPNRKKFAKVGTFFTHPRIYTHEPMRATQPNKARLTKASELRNNRETELQLTPLLKNLNIQRTINCAAGSPSARQRRTTSCTQQSSPPSSLSPSLLPASSASAPAPTPTGARSNPNRTKSKGRHSPESRPAVFKLRVT